MFPDYGVGAGSVEEGPPAAETTASTNWYRYFVDRFDEIRN